VTTRRDNMGTGTRSAMSSLRARLEHGWARRRGPAATAGRPGRPGRLGQRPAAWPVPVPGCDPRVFDLFRDAAARGGRAA
jgi:hypothetical protein